MSMERFGILLVEDEEGHASLFEEAFEDIFEEDNKKGNVIKECIHVDRPSLAKDWLFDGSNLDRFKAHDGSIRLMIVLDLNFRFDNKNEDSESESDAESERFEDGLEFLRMLKVDREFRDKKLNRIPVIILSTEDDQFQVNTAYDNHASSYLVKRDEYEPILEAIKSYWDDKVQFQISEKK